LKQGFAVGMQYGKMRFGFVPNITFGANRRDSLSTPATVYDCVKRSWRYE